MTLSRLRTVRLRANPAFDLVPFDRLPPQEQERLRELRRDPDLYGILQPRSAAAIGVKTMDTDSALLFLTLCEPDLLPSYVHMRLGADCDKAVARLIADGVLEFEHDGAFLSGATALAMLCDPAPVSTGKLAQLSVAALQYGQELHMTDAMELATRLYLYNRIPTTPDWEKRFPSSDKLAVHLGVAVGGSQSARLNRYWTANDVADGDVWWSWTHRQAPLRRRRGQFRYKLYVSPEPLHLREAFSSAVTVFTEMRAPHFKVGKDLYGMLRPDKLVAYFDQREHLDATADRLRHYLAGCPFHGVPFTAAVEETGLLSWGMDPPHTEQPLPTMGHESWRLWVVKRLAVALIMAAAAPAGGMEPWQSALQRIGLEGIDLETWAPVNPPWQMETEE